MGPYSGLEKVFESVETPVNHLHFVEAALFQAAKKLKIRTLLSGFGGDMTISDDRNKMIQQYYRKFKIIKA